MRQQLRGQSRRCARSGLGDDVEPLAIEPIGTATYFEVVERCPLVGGSDDTPDGDVRHLETPGSGTRTAAGLPRSIRFDRDDIKRCRRVLRQETGGADRDTRAHQAADDRPVRMALCLPPQVLDGEHCASPYVLSGLSSPPVSVFCRSAAAPRRPPMPMDSTAVLGTSISAPFSFNPSYSMFMARRCKAVGLS